MFSIRVPFRKITFVDKDRIFTEILDFSTYTKKEAQEMYKDKGFIVSFERGFKVFDITPNDISNEVLERIYNEMKEGK
jgi:phosphosulfolactate synthase (CoM biosynthesis protein A)